MRLRNIPDAAGAVADSPYVIHDPLAHPVQPCGRPLHVEIGMGKGRFLLSLAAENPQIRYIGIERYASVLYRALQKLEDPASPAPENLSFICENAVRIDAMFAPESIDLIYLNFSDPWPKKRHAHRRLTDGSFLNRYRNVLSSTGRIEVKTDNTALFQFTIDELSASGWDLLSLTYDLHHDPVLSAGNHMTEYEEKFSGEGHPICKLTARPAPVR